MRISEFGTIGLCIDECNEETLRGRMIVPVCKEPVEFKSLNKLVALIGEALDKAGVPHAFMEFRVFEKRQKTSSLGEDDQALYEHQSYSGKIATFLIKILYRQNASWQGKVTWVEKGKTEKFRSALELFVLIESTL